MSGNKTGNRVAVLFAHPALEKSRVNRRLAEAVRTLERVTFHDLYEAYPEFDIDLEHEQRLLDSHDVIVFQHPFYWYSTPALLKEWEDLVLEHGWAYGTDGYALRGKKALSAITTGGSEAAYAKQGDDGFTMNDLLLPIEQTFRLCHMDYLPPFVVHGTHRLDENAIVEQAKQYRRVVEALRDGKIDFDLARQHDRLNARLSEIIRD
jgi:glutathione-regulated potassium-efflux system ancillary protein KefG